MILGQALTKISGKHQLAFPKKFRDVLGEKVILTKGPSRNLVAVAQKHWSTLLEGTENKPFINKDARDLQTFLLGNATEVIFDSQGRFVVPEYLRAHAGLTTDVLFVGVNTYVQIWDKNRWDDYQTYLQNNIDPITDRLSGSD